MAKRQFTQLVDDLDGLVIHEGGRTISFGLEGKSFEIDLSPANVDALHAALAPFVEAARVIPRTRWTTVR